MLINIVQAWNRYDADKMLGAGQICSDLVEALRVTQDAILCGHELTAAGEFELARHVSQLCLKQLRPRSLHVEALLVGKLHPVCQFSGYIAGRLMLVWLAQEEPRHPLRAADAQKPATPSLTFTGLEPGLVADTSNLQQPISEHGVRDVPWDCLPLQPLQLREHVRRVLA